ncbi:MAG: hypothetical protein AAFV07_09760 [Bacteroidota bacterium]
MRKLYTLLCLLIAATTLQAQSSQPNFSIQVGYQALYLNPTPFNFLADSLYNVQVADLSERMGNIKWTTGPSVGIAYHRGRSALRLSGRYFAARAFAVRTDDMGAVVRRDVRLTGLATTLQLTSELVPITDLLSFYVGGGFSLFNLQIQSEEVPNNSFSAADPLKVIENRNKLSFLLQTPFRLRLPPRFMLSLEPYYQVFFGPLEFEPLAQEIVPEPPASNGKITGELDHFGVNFSFIVFLRRE